MGLFSDKVAIVTGATDGQCAEEAKVVTTYIQSERVESAVNLNSRLQIMRAREKP